MGKMELLAPAGNASALHAAVRAGADAVYLGLEAFNARRGADNFTIATLKEACDYAHLRGVKVYVTLNIVVLPGEVGQALECARQAWRAGADALIIQDIGLASEIARALPDIRIHISTQMNTCNAAGIRAAARMGAKRVTLARELSVEEIAHLAQVGAEEGVEVEAFGHGALCICYSGQCFMSSMIGGRSANRGLCAQACRLPYELHNAAQRNPLSAPGEHLLSPKDLCSADLLSDLARAGVASLKIEGRMKSADYVSSVVSVYRRVLDRVYAEDGVILSARPTADERRALEEAFSRGFTTAYLEGQRGNDIMSYQRPNNRGAFIGRVAEVRGGVAVVSAERDLYPGDVLEFWTGKGHAAQTVGDLDFDKKGRAKVALDARVRGVRAGDRVFRVRSAQDAFADEPLEPRVEVTGSVRMRIGEPLEVSFSFADSSRGDFSQVSGTACGPEVEPARTKAVTEQDVRAHIDRLGSTPYVLAHLDVELDEGAGIGFSQLHHVRAEALDNLTENALAAYHARRLPRTEEREELPAARPSGARIGAWATNPVCARAAKRTGAHLIYVPALNYGRGEAAVAGQLSATVEQAGYPKQCMLAMPTVDHDEVGLSREAKLDFDPWQYVKSGRPVFVESLGAMQMAADMGVPFEVGPHLPVTNRLALDEVVRKGATRVWLSPELSLDQIRSLSRDTPVELGIFISGAQELMITEHCLLMSQGPCNEDCANCRRRRSPHYLKDRKGYEFPVVTDALGRSHLYNSVDLDLAPSLPDLMAAGVTSFMVDTTLMNGEQAAQAVGRAIRALRNAQSDGNPLAKIASATTGHLFRGVQ